MQFLILDSIEDYKNYFINNYCKADIYTYNGIHVKFYEDQFEHCCYESANFKKRDKSIFSHERAKRLSWIKDVLKDKNAEVYVGWDRDKKIYNYNRRISIISPDNYVVVINLINKRKAKFITAYVASKTNARKIRSAPKF